MAELVDAADLKSAGRKAVGVQVPLPPSLSSPSKGALSGLSRLQIEDRSRNQNLIWGLGVASKGFLMRQHCPAD